MVLALGAVGAAGVYYTNKKATEAVGAVANNLNPNSQDNIINQGVLAVGRTISGNPNWSLGGSIHDIVNGTPSEQAERAQEKLFIQSIGG